MISNVKKMREDVFFLLLFAFTNEPSNQLLKNLLRMTE